MHTKGERTCGSYVRSTCRAKRHPGRGLAPNANDGGGRHAPTTRVARASAARLAPALPSAAPAERGWSSSIVASTDARWAVRRAVRRAENAQPRRNMRTHRAYRCGSREERAARHRSWRARPYRGSPSLQTAEQGCQHMSTDSQAVVCQCLLLTFVMSLVSSEVVGWLPSENFGELLRQVTSRVSIAPPPVSCTKAVRLICLEEPPWERGIQRA